MTTAEQSLSTTSLWSRLYGFGSVFAKTVRDSRRATLIAGALLAAVFLGISKAIVTEFDTPESRAEIDALVAAVPPILQGLAGKVVNVGTLGGYLQYKYGTFFPLVLSLWSILALSGTLAGEAARGSLEFVVATGRSRRRVALEKLSGHVLMLSLATFVAFLSITYAGSAYPVLPGDEISVLQAFGYSIWMGLIVLAGGALAFALAPFIGRGAAAGIAGFVTFAGFILNGYQQPVPDLAPFANLTWWGWTQNHVALGGEFDWPSVALVAVVTVILLGIGVEAFARRDIGVTSSVPVPSMPRSLLGLSGPVPRAISLNLGSALAWGLGVGFFGLVMGATAGGFMDALRNSPQFLELLSTAFPNVDYASPSGFLQLLFVEFGMILAGLAAATFVGGWASDETSGRLEILLAAPLARVRWAVAGGIGMLVNVAVFVGLIVVGIAIGVGSIGGEVGGPVVGVLVLGLYAAALAGIGLAVGGVFGTRFAAPVVVVLVIVTWFVQFLGPLLNLPEVIRQLALTSHYGQPMVGVWDPVGIVASVMLAIGGIGVGAVAFARRDLRS